MTTRVFTQGDEKDQSLRIRELQVLLEDRKQANVMLNAEIQRLKRNVYDLQQRLGDIEAGRYTKRGEATSMAAFRSMAATAREKQAIVAQSMEQAMQQNQELLKELSSLNDAMKALKDEAISTQVALAAAQADLAQAKKENEALGQQNSTLAQQCHGLQQKLDEAFASAKHLEQQNGQLSKQAEQVMQEARQQAEQHVAKHAEQLRSEAGTASQEADAKVVAKEQQLQALQGRLQAAREVGQLPMTFKVVNVAEPQALPNSQAAGAGMLPAPPLGIQQADARLSAMAVYNAPSGVVALSASPPVAGTAPSALNFIEVVLHGAALDPVEAGKASVVLVAIEAAGMPRKVLMYPVLTPPSVPFNTVYRIPIADDYQAINLLVAGTLQLALHNPSACFLGGFECPGADGDMSRLQHVAAAAIEYSPGCTCVEVLTLDNATGLPISHFLTLSTDWTAVLPSQASCPEVWEFVVDVQRLHSLQLEAIRACGLFDVVQGVRSFQGTDGRLYQVWRPNAESQRRQATARRLTTDLQCVADVAPAQGLIGRCSFDLKDILACPTIKALEANAVWKQLDGNAAVASIYDAHDANGTWKMGLKNSHGQVTCSLSLTPRLHHPVHLTDPLLRTLQAVAGRSPPSYQATGGSGPATGSGAATEDQIAAAGGMPLMHWSHDFGAEQVHICQLLSHLQAAVDATSHQLLTSPATHPDAMQAAQQAVRDAQGVIEQKAQLLARSLERCRDSVKQVPLASPEADLAHTLLQGCHAYVQRHLSHCSNKLRGHLSMCTLVSWLLQHTKVGQSITITPFSPLQLQLLSDLDVAVDVAGSNLQQQHPAPSVADALLPAAAAAAAGAMVDANATTTMHTLNTAPQGKLGIGVPTAMITRLRESVDAAAAMAGAAIETARRQMAAPNASEQQITAAAQQQVCSAVTGMLGAVVEVVSDIQQGAAKHLLRDPTTAAAAAAAASLPAQPAFTGLQVDPARAAVSASTAVDAASSTTGHADVAAALQGIWQQQLKPAVARLLRAEPVPVPSAEATAAAWVRSSQQLHNTLQAACTVSAATVAAGAAHLLMLNQHWQQAMKLVLAVMMPEILCCIDSAATAIKQANANKMLDVATSKDAVDTILTSAKQQISTSLVMAYELATQILVTPIHILSKGASITEVYCSSNMQLCCTNAHAIQTASIQELQKALSGIDSNSNAPAVAEDGNLLMQSREPGNSKDNAPLSSWIAMWHPKRCIAVSGASKAVAAATEKAIGEDTASSTDSLVTCLQAAAEQLGWQLTVADDHIPELAGSTSNIPAGHAAAKAAIVANVGPDIASSTVLQTLGQSAVLQLTRLELEKVPPKDMPQYLIARLVMSDLSHVTPVAVPHNSSYQIGSSSSSNGYNTRNSGSSSSNFIPTVLTFLGKSSLPEAAITAVRQMHQSIYAALMVLQQEQQHVLPAAIQQPLTAMVADCLKLLNQRNHLLLGVLQAPAAAAEHARQAATAASTSSMPSNASALAPPVGRKLPKQHITDQPSTATPPENYDASISSTGGGPSMFSNPVQREKLSMSGAAAAPQQQQQRWEADSTDSEDEERNILPLSHLRLPAYNDETETESDVASICSASTVSLGSRALPALRRK